MRNLLIAFVMVIGISGLGVLTTKDNGIVNESTIEREERTFELAGYRWHITDECDE